MQDFLHFVEKWFNAFINLFQKYYHSFKDLGLIPEVE